MLSSKMPPLVKPCAVDDASPGLALVIAVTVLGAAGEPEMANVVPFGKIAAMVMPFQERKSPPMGGLVGALSGPGVESVDRRRVACTARDDVAAWLVDSGGRRKGLQQLHGDTPRRLAHADRAGKRRSQRLCRRGPLADRADDADLKQPGVAAAGLLDVGSLGLR